MSALAGGQGRPSPPLAWTLVAMGVLQLPLGMLSAARLMRVASRQAVVARVLFAGVTLATTSWFASLALATGQRGTPVHLLLGLLMVAYGLGFIVTGRLAETAAMLPPRTPPDAQPPQAQAS